MLPLFVCFHVLNLLICCPLPALFRRQGIGQGEKMDIITLIQTFGFPVAACAAMAWYVKYITDENNKRLDDLNRDHKEEVQSLSTALANNTLALQKLTDYLTRSEDELRDR